MFKRFVSYYKPHKKLFLFVLFSEGIVVLLGMIYPIITRNLLNNYVPNKNLRLIIIMGILLFFLYLIKAIFKYFVDFYGHMVGTYMQADMRKELFNKLEKLPFNYYDNNETGKIMSRIINDLFEISELAHHGPENLLSALWMLTFSLIYLGNINLLLTLIIFSSLPLLFLITYILRKKHLIETFKARKALAQINADVSSSIQGIRVTKAFNNSLKEEEKFKKGNDEFVKAKKGQYNTMSLFHASSVFISDAFKAICILAGGIFLYKGTINVGDYSAFIISISFFVQPITTLINMAEVYQEGTTGFIRFIEILDLPIEEDKKDAKKYTKLNGDIEFKDVYFSYEKNDEKEVLNGVSFKIESGKTTALIGPSGGGKTTICHLLPKFYHIDDGQILINSIDIENIKMESLRNNIGIVQQDVFLFNGTIYDNILYGKLNASKKAVIEASKKAKVYDFIMSLPDGFDTQIGERGIKLSGGQKQRLSIARVFLKNPSILILDEATSALDNSTELLIQESLNDLKEGRTTIIVAHRLSTIKNADKIIVIENGQVIEQGNHSSLIKKKNGLYHKLYKDQFKGLD